MKSITKRLLSLMTVLVMALTLLPGAVLAEAEATLLAEGTAVFETYVDAFLGESVQFTPETNGDVTVEILSSTPGYYVDIYAGDDWLEDHWGEDAGNVTFGVTAGVAYEILLCSFNMDEDDVCAGSLSYRVSFVSDGEVPGGEEPEDPSLIPGATPENPKLFTGSGWDYIGAGKTVWYLYDNTQLMEEQGVYSMMLHITSGVDYSVRYADQDVPVDENGFVNYEMQDTAKEGLYLFSVTNHAAEQGFFSIEVKGRPVYVDSGLELVLGRNNVTLDPTVPYTLYEFSPSQTGIYQIRAAQGRIGDWGTAYNPVDNTPNKTNMLIWTCTAAGQSIMVGFTGPAATTCTIIRTGDYIPPVEEPWVIYENEFKFDYELNADAEIVDVDLTDGGAHTAVLGEDGFYHYGGEEGPLMVTDLTAIEINVSDAYVNGGLRAWLQDGDGKTISKVNYNEAMNEYYNAGLVPVTEELAVMLQELGQANGWWLDGGIVFKNGAPADLSNAWMQLCGYLEENKGVILCGQVTAGNEGNVTVELLSGETVIATVAAADGYVLENVLPGTYTLQVSKENHVTRQYEVTVEEETVVLDVKIHLIGDVDGNGKVNMGDVAKINAHVKGTALITDDYQLLCANVNGGSLNMGDTAALSGHIKGTKKLY